MELSQAFRMSLAPNPGPRKQAEDDLRNFSQQPNYAMAVLQLVADASVEIEIRQAAAVNFKNHVKYMWNPSADQDGPGIAEQEKEQIKPHLVRLMLASPPKIQSQLSEALALISSHDFPSKWNELLPELVTCLSSSTGYETINVILQAINAIFKKFRYGYKSVQLYTELKYCLDGFAAPLLELFLKTGQLIKSTQDPNVLKPLFVCQRLCCRIFYSLNSQELPEFFENNMQQWMDEFHYFLMYNNPGLAERDPEKENVVDQVKTAICANINLYMEKNEEEFQGFLPRFATDVWNLLTSTSLHDQLAISGMKFLTTVSRSVHHGLFSGGDILTQLCECIAIPNVRVREDDETLFEMNPLEYIRRDIEGSDQDTRRRAACELVKGLMVHHKDQVTGLMSKYIQGLIGKYTANPAENWKDKDAAIYLVVALAQKQAGSAMTDFVNLEQFFTSQIVPELQSPDINSSPMLKADALKFITTFRSTIPHPMALALVSQISRFLCSESNVVHSYAAGCVEKLLLPDKTARFTSAEIAPIQDQLLGNLFGALRLPESQENPYVMKCIMRIVSLADVGPQSLNYFDGLMAVLKEVCKNPKTPTFNHYIFESVAALVRKACQRDQQVVTAFEQRLLPVLLLDILQKDVVEFEPYAFQIIAQLIESRPVPIPTDYLQLFPAILTEQIWKKSTLVPGLVQLLRALLLRAPPHLLTGNLQQIVSVFSQLVAKKSTETHGMFIANTMVESLSQELLMPWVPFIWSGLFSRLQNAQLRTVKFLKLLVIFMSLFIVKHGQAVVVNSINTVSPSQPALFSAILEQFWIPTLSSISGTIEVKLCAVASTRLLCESPVLLAAESLWGRLLNGVVVLLVKPQEAADDEGDVPDVEQVSSYTGVYAKLHNAGKTEDDPLKEIKDPKEYLCSCLNQLSAQYPSKFPLIIQQYMEPGNRDALVQLCNTYRTTIV